MLTYGVSEGLFYSVRLELNQSGWKSKNEGMGPNQKPKDKYSLSSC